jgi:NAD(P)-dependent dehydrogenase (short-subunit alcohol dehydrogenase family)
MMSDYPDAMLAIVTAASRGMGAAGVPRIGTDGDRVALLSPSHEARYVTGEFICTDGGLTRAVR